MKQIGMIGAGNMGSAILRGIVDAGYAKSSQLSVFDVSKRKMREISEDIPGIYEAQDCLEVAERADVLILAVKPLYYDEVIRELRPGLRGKAVISIAAGWTVSMLEKALKDAVCSPGGTAIEAVAVLERQGFRNALMEAVHACARKSREMSKD